MKITMEHHGEKHSYESESGDGLNATALVNILFNFCVSAGWHRDSITDAMHEKVCESMDEKINQNQ
tara:strand:- start:718 stop:915 length:198 start_codon:yes stop_codon:yes gene_type:complete